MSGADVRWVCVNKGDNVNPDIRARLVAQEIRQAKRYDVFAGTPPLEALKILLSDCATEDHMFKYGDRILDFIDIRKAHTIPLCEQDVYIELPSECVAGNGKREELTY